MNALMELIQGMFFGYGFTLGCWGAILTVIYMNDNV